MFRHLLCEPFCRLITLTALSLTTLNTVQAEILTQEEAGKIFLHSAGNAPNVVSNESALLVGRTLTADFSNGQFRVLHQFHDDGLTMSWEILEGFEKGQKGTVPYQAFQLRPGITLVTMQPLPIESLLLVIDDNTGSALGYLGRLVDKQSDRPLIMKVLQGPILESKADNHYSSKTITAGLTGTRFSVTYPQATYQQIYLSEHYMTWLATSGSTTGVADTERYYSIKVAPQLYLVGWNERAAPIQASLLLDFSEKRELGAFFGFDSERQKAVYRTTTGIISGIEKGFLIESGF